jgi:hypothetical protein
VINLRVLSIAVAVALGMLGAVQLAAPESLGISPVAARWLGIVAAGLGILQGFLPRVQGPTTDPEALADRVWNLPTTERQLVADDLATRAERQTAAHAEDMERRARFGTPPPVPDISFSEDR